MKPSIIHAAQWGPPYGGNFLASLIALRARCEENGWRLVMVVPPKARQRPWYAGLTAAGQQVEVVPSPPDTSVVHCVRALARIAQRENGIIFHTHFSQYDVAAWGASCLLRTQGKKVKIVWHKRSDFLERMTLIRWIKDFTKYRFMGRAIHVIAVSEHLRQKVLKAGFPAARIRTIPNGVDLDRASASTRSRAEMLAELGVGEGKRLVLLFGWEPATKGVDLAMDAVQTLVKEGRRIVLGVVGRERLREYVQARTDGKPPSWLRVIPPKQNVADLYQAASVFLSASRSEGLPSSVSEAMGNMVPAVLSDIPAVSWAHQIPGAVFFPPGDSSSLAAGMRKVLDWGPLEREQVTTAGRDLVRGKFDIHSWVEQVFRVYQEIL